MKNPIPQFSIVLISIVIIAFLMGYTKPLAEEPKEYILIYGNSAVSLTQNVNQKISEGWRPQGGVTLEGGLCQPMVK
jgi:hypothetical protein